MLSPEGVLHPVVEVLFGEARKLLGHLPPYNSALSVTAVTRASAVWQHSNSSIGDKSPLHLNPPRQRGTWALWPVFVS